MKTVWQFIDHAATVATIVVAAVLLWTIGFSGRPALSRNSDQPTRASTPVQKVSELVTPIDERDQVAPTVRLAVVEYSDFACPFCRRHATATLPDLKRTFVDGGRVAYLFRNMPLVSLHPDAYRSAQIAECARDQGHFWEAHDTLFRSQQARNEKTLEYLFELGLDRTRLENCLGKATTQTTIERDIVEGSRLGVNVTPSFLIGTISNDRQSVRIARKITGAQAFEIFKTELQSMLDGLQTPP